MLQFSRRRYQIIFQGVVFNSETSHATLEGNKHQLHHWKCKKYAFPLAHCHLCEENNMSISDVDVKLIDLIATSNIQLITAMKEDNVHVRIQSPSSVRFWLISAAIIQWSLFGSVES